MLLWNVIYNLLKASLYGSWGIALCCIPCAMIMMIYNLVNGVASVIICFAGLLCAMGLALLLMPKGWKQHELFQVKHLYFSVALLLVSMALTGFAFLMTQDFPVLDLVFA